MNKLKLNPGKTEVLLIRNKREVGVGVQTALIGVSISLKGQICSWFLFLEGLLRKESLAAN